MIHEKILKVMEDIQYLQKDIEVSTGNGKSYKAIKEAKVTAAVRASFIKNKIIVYPITQEHKRDDTVTIDKYKNERVQRLTTVDITYRFLDVENPESYIDVPSSGTGIDTQDKGVGKAMTYSYKYLMLRTFAIPTGEDPDEVSDEILDNMYSNQYKPPSKQTDTDKKEYWKEFQEECQRLEVDSMDFIASLGVDSADKKAIGRQIYKFLRYKEEFIEQLMVYKDR